MNTGPGQGGAHGPSSLQNWWPTDSRHTSSSSSDVMSQLCRVCGEPAAGFHFGAFTCEGCKSFFGRTYNNLSSISECKNNGECVINKKNRTSCKACRLRKCLVVGMSKSGSRYGRRSNWFKIHCLLQEQQQQHNQHQQQSHTHQQHLLHPAAGEGDPLGMPFQQQPPQQQPQQHQQQQQRTAVDRPPPLDPGRTSPPPLSWMDVKHHRMRLDADNNNSVSGDLNKDGGVRLSVSAAAAAAAAAAAVQVVRPEMLRWPSPFFPAFPFPPPMPFFLAMQTPTPTPPLPPPPPLPLPLPAPQSSNHRRPRSSCSPSYRSSSADDDPLPSPPKKRALQPVQESPMDLSVSAVQCAPPPSSLSSSSSSSSASSASRSPSSGDNGVGCRDGGDDDIRSPGSSPTAAQLSRRHRRRRRRRRRRLRRLGDHVTGRDLTSGSESESSGSNRSASSVAVDVDDGRRPAKNSPLDLTCNRS